MNNHSLQGETKKMEGSTRKEMIVAQMTLKTTGEAGSQRVAENEDR